MKTIALRLLTALSILLPLSVHSSDPAKISNQDRLVGIALASRDHDTNERIFKDEEELKALHDAYPVLVRLSKCRWVMEEFWPTVMGKTSFNTSSGDTADSIPWKEAKNLIEGGYVTSIVQFHRGKRPEIVLVTRTGEIYRAPQEKIDQAYHILKKIDPTGVFVDYGTE